MAQNRSDFPLSLSHERGTLFRVRVKEENGISKATYATKDKGYTLAIDCTDLPRYMPDAATTTAKRRISFFAKAIAILTMGMIASN